MNETYTIDGNARSKGDEVLRLLRAYEAAGFSLMQMRNNAMFEFDPVDIRRLANTDLMPIRINGTLFEVSEQSASCVGVAAMYMEQWRQESHHTAGMQPRKLTISLLANILSGLNGRQTVTITPISVSQGVMRISYGNSNSEVADVVAALIALAAIGLNHFGAEELLGRTVTLRPV